MELTFWSILFLIDYLSIHYVTNQLTNVTNQLTNENIKSKKAIEDLELKVEELGAIVRKLDSPMYQVYPYNSLLRNQLNQSSVESKFR
jgi:hypothetical protein